jgi:hypothetical protein
MLGGRERGEIQNSPEQNKGIYGSKKKKEVKVSL